MPTKRASVTAGLFAEAEVQAEKTVALLRIIMSSTLAAIFIFAVLPSVDEIDPTLTWQMVWAGLTIVSYFLLGVFTYSLARRGKFRPWMGWPVVTADVGFVLINIWATLVNTGLSANYLITLPPIWLAPVVLAVGALRFNPYLQTYVAVLLVGGLAFVAWSVPGWQWGELVSPPDTVGFLFAGPPNVMRLAMLGLAAMVLVVASFRARHLLTRAIAETQRSANLTRYLPNQVADRLASDGIDVVRRGARQNVAVLFVDIRGFTARAEAMAPEDISQFISGYRGCITDAVEATGGSVDKFIGDGAMVVFGLVPDATNDAVAALDCAEKILSNLTEWRAGHQDEYPLAVGIGLHWGEAFCGAIGDERRLEYTVLGDTVNVAARLEQLTKEAGWTVIASKEILQKADRLEDGRWSELENTSLRGRADPIVAFGASGL